MAALTSKILNNTLHFWKTFLFTSLPTCSRLQLTGLCSPYLTLLLPHVLSGSRDSWFSSLAAYFGLSFVHNNWPLLLYCLSKHCCCSGCPGSSGGPIIHSHDSRSAPGCLLFSNLHLSLFLWESLQMPSFQLPTEHLLSDVPRSTSDPLFLKY